MVAVEFGFRMVSVHDVQDGVVVGGARRPQQPGVDVVHEQHGQQQQ